MREQPWLVASYLVWCSGPAIFRVARLSRWVAGNHSDPMSSECETLFYAYAGLKSRERISERTITAQPIYI